MPGFGIRRAERSTIRPSLLLMQGPQLDARSAEFRSIIAIHGRAIVQFGNCRC
jgi:hypothetical protein